MPGSSTRRSYPYPSAGDAPDGPGGIYALAQKLDLDTAWTQYFPSGNWTGGTGSSAAFYWQLAAGYVHVRGRAKMGTSPGIPNPFRISLPTLPAGMVYAQEGFYAPAGSAIFNHSGTIYQALAATWNTANLDATPPDTIAIFAVGTNGAATNPTTPFVWATGDYFDLKAQVPVA